MHLEMVKRFREWIEFYNVHKGTVVRINRKAESYENGWNDSWVEGMDNFVGKISVVESDIDSFFYTSGLSVRVTNLDIYDTKNFPFFVIEVVDDAVRSGSPIWGTIGNIEYIVKDIQDNVKTEKGSRVIRRYVNRVSERLVEIIRKMPGENKESLLNEYVSSYTSNEREWACTNHIHVGSLVKLTRSARAGELGWNNVWCSDMSRNVRKVGKVTEISEPHGNGIRVSFNDYEIYGYQYPFFVFSPVEATPACTPIMRKLTYLKALMADVINQTGSGMCELSMFIRIVMENNIIDLDRCLDQLSA